MAARPLRSSTRRAPVATITKTAEPLETVGLADHGARPHDLPSLTPGVAGGTDLIQP